MSEEEEVMGSIYNAIACGKSVNFIEKLLGVGADVEEIALFDCGGREFTKCILYFAIEKARDDIAILLLRHGADSQNGVTYFEYINPTTVNKKKGESAYECAMSRTDLSRELALILAQKSEEREDARNYVRRLIEQWKATSEDCAKLSQNKLSRLFAQVECFAAHEQDARECDAFIAQCIGELRRARNEKIMRKFEREVALVLDDEHACGTFSMALGEESYIAIFAKWMAPFSFDREIRARVSTKSRRFQKCADEAVLEMVKEIKKKRKPETIDPLNIVANASASVRNLFICALGKNGNTPCKVM